MNDTTRPVVPTADASMHDMLRIMDVASAMRRERETAEAVLDLGAAKTKLRERLLATAAAAGEPVTPAEVDTAIDEYFRRQHEYVDPPAGWGTFWAHAWVLRRSLAVALLVLVLATGGILVFVQAMASSFDEPQPAPRPAPGPAVRQPAESPMPGGPTPPPAPPAQPDPGAELATAWTRFQQDVAAAQVLAADDDGKQRVQRLLERGTAAHGTSDLARLRTAAGELTTLVQRLDEQYTVTIVSRPGEQSGVDRHQNGRLSGYYLIVEAVTADDRRLPRRIKNGETQRTETVTKWGEEVSESVWNRIVADKQADGVVDDAYFAHKDRGIYDEKTVLKDEGKPLRRGRQITKW